MILSVLLLVCMMLVGSAQAADCGLSIVHDCTTISKEEDCKDSYTPPQTPDGQGTGCLWYSLDGQKWSCVKGSKCDVNTPQPTPIPTPAPTTLAPSTLSPENSSSPTALETHVPTPAPGSSDGMSTGLKALLFFISYFAAIGIFWGSVKTYRHFFPPESKTQAALSLLRGGKK
eukprot:TRINITY_DN4246_c0_g3_i1.p1 TRINITY_DN4246_c0_g3~~TRINITY_DN4246_c0_g3_i1.p1  ORF type:complete len:191 (+),score=33.28 TRINITY_DN4246_c0_g3_i1:55-573(+)